MKIFDCLKEFRESYDTYPSQDNEGYVPERGSFKSGFHACYVKLNPEFMKAQQALRERDRERDAWKAYAGKLRKALEFYGQPLKPDKTGLFAKSAEEWGEIVATWDPLLDLGDKAREALSLPMPGERK